MMTVLIECIEPLLVVFLNTYTPITGADLGFSERGANQSSGSSRGSGGHSPPEAIGYFVL